MKKRLAMIATIIFSLSLTLFAARADEWKQEPDGRWWYQHDDGGYTSNDWEEIDGVWYYFYSDGYMAHDTWIGDYYVGSDGGMLKDTTTPDGFRVGADGKKINENASLNITSDTFTDQADIIGVYTFIHKCKELKGKLTDASFLDMTLGITKISDQEILVMVGMLDKFSMKDSYHYSIMTSKDGINWIESTDSGGSKGTLRFEGESAFFGSTTGKREFVFVKEKK